MEQLSNLQLCALHYFCISLPVSSLSVLLHFLQEKTKFVFAKLITYISQILFCIGTSFFIQTLLKCETITNVTFDVNVTIVITNCVTSCTKNQPSTLFLYNCPQKPLTQRPWPSVTLSKMLICSLFTPLQTSLTRLVAKLAC